jgi:hypothetical protein
MTLAPLVYEHNPKWAYRKGSMAQVRNECERRGQPKIGMTPDEATAACWGKPSRVVKVTTAAGVKERFVYGSGHVLEFENDKLSAILESSGR